MGGKLEERLMCGYLQYTEAHASLQANWGLRKYACLAKEGLLQKII